MVKVLNRYCEVQGCNDEGVVRLPMGEWLCQKHKEGHMGCGIDGEHCREEALENEVAELEKRLATALAAIKAIVKAPTSDRRWGAIADAEALL
jgi:hypothetical protein